MASKLHALLPWHSNGMLLQSSEQVMAVQLYFFTLGLPSSWSLAAGARAGDDVPNAVTVSASDAAAAAAACSSTVVPTTPPDVPTLSCCATTSNLRRFADGTLGTPAMMPDISEGLTDLALLLVLLKVWSAAGVPYM